jgi:hypothetical protein
MALKGKHMFRTKKSKLLEKHFEYNCKKMNKDINKLDVLSKNVIIFLIIQKNSSEIVLLYLCKIIYLNNLYLPITIF